jgi:hypothetical protein
MNGVRQIFTSVMKYCKNIENCKDKKALAHYKETLNILYVFN